MPANGDTEYRLHEALNEVIEYFKQEYSITYYEAIGVLEAVKLDLYGELDCLMEIFNEDAEDLLDDEDLADDLDWDFDEDWS